MTPDQIVGRHAAQTQRCTPWRIYRPGAREPLAFVPARMQIQTAAAAVAWYRRVRPETEHWPLEARPGAPVVVAQRVDEVAP